MKSLSMLLVCFFLIQNCHASHYICFELKTPFKEKTKDQWTVEKNLIKKTLDVVDGILTYKITFFNLKDEQNNELSDVSFKLRGFEIREESKDSLKLFINVLQQWRLSLINIVEQLIKNELSVFGHWASSSKKKSLIKSVKVITPDQIQKAAEMIAADFVQVKCPGE